MLKSAARAQSRYKCYAIARVYKKRETARQPFSLGLNRDYKSDVPTVNDKLHDHRVILLVSLMFLFGFLLVATLRSSFVTLDLNVNAWAASINKDSFTAVAEGISIIFDTNGLVILSAVLAAVFSVKNRWQYGVLLIGAIGGIALIVAASKMFIMSPRPLNEIIHLTDYSFPSGHVAGNVVFFGILTYFAWKNWTSARTKWSTGHTYIATIVLIGFGRIYLNVHWFSDVVAGFLLGAFWLVFTLWVFHRMIARAR
jgi:membrane-associated phospholipid phosphatase